MKIVAISPVRADCSACTLWRWPSLTEGLVVRRAAAWICDPAAAQELRPARVCSRPRHLQDREANPVPAAWIRDPRRGRPNHPPDVRIRNPSRRGGGYSMSPVAVVTHWAHAQPLTAATASSRTYRASSRHSPP